MAQTATEKILARATGRAVREGEIIHPEPDLVTVHDWYVVNFDKELQALGVKRLYAPEKVVISTDHEPLAVSVAAAERQREVRRIVAKYGIERFFDAGRGGHGHVFPMEYGFVKPGMFARIAIASGPARPVPLAPIEAVIRTGERSVVIVQEAPGKFRPVEVATGNEADGRVEITKGLRTGDVVVVSGQFLIDSEASLKSAGARMLEPSAASYEGIGKIERIAPDAITLTHEPIPALKWGEMTMEFKPPTAGWPSNVRVGDAIRFEFRAGKSAGDYELTRVTPLDAKVKR